MDAPNVSKPRIEQSNHPGALNAVIRYIVNVLIGIDVTANAVLGGMRYQTISSRIGVSMINGGWASRVSWPEWWRQHCYSSVTREWV